MEKGSTFDFDEHERKISEMAASIDDALDLKGEARQEALRKLKFSDLTAWCGAINRMPPRIAAWVTAAARTGYRRKREKR